MMGFAGVAVQAGTPMTVPGEGHRAPKRRGAVDLPTGLVFFWP